MCERRLFRFWLSWFFCGYDQVYIEDVGLDISVNYLGSIISQTMACIAGPYVWKAAVPYTCHPTAIFIAFSFHVPHKFHST